MFMADQENSIGIHLKKSLLANRASYHPIDRRDKLYDAVEQRTWVAPWLSGLFGKSRPGCTSATATVYGSRPASVLAANRSAIIVDRVQLDLVPDYFCC
jgi:hypothetical protein